MVTKNLNTKSDFCVSVRDTLENLKITFSGFCLGLFSIGSLLNIVYWIESWCFKG